MTKALVRQRVEAWAKAIRARDIDGVVSLYAPDIVSFDVGPPLRYAGTDHKRRAWQAMFATYDGVIGYEVTDLAIAVDGDLAFAYSLNHVSGKLASGHDAAMWLRWAACFRRIDGGWLVVHDHASVPADLEHGRAVLDLKP